MVRLSLVSNTANNHGSDLKGCERRGFASVRSLAVLAILTAVVACSRNVSDMELAEKNDGLIQKASAFEREKDFESAMDVYYDVIDRDSRNALAHLYLGILLHDSRRDYIGAIYHYKQYLELRPSSEKKEMIGNRIRLAEIAFAGAVAGQDAQDARISELEAENESLKTELAQLRSMADSVPGQESRILVNPDRAGREPYTVRKNDSLRSIAIDRYGDEDAWVRIYELNRDAITDPHNIKEGQILVMP